MYRYSNRAMGTWIGVFSDDVVIRQVEIEADDLDSATVELERYEYAGFRLANIRPKRGGKRANAGRPKGIKRAGNYGDGVATKPVRVPIDVADNLPEMIQNLSHLKELLNDWEQEANSSTSPRYDRARKLLAEIRALGF